MNILGNILAVWWQCFSPGDDVDQTPWGELESESEEESSEEEESDAEEKKAPDETGFITPAER